MLKENKRNLILSSVVTMLPVLFGLLLWDKLPEQMTTHWGFDGTADGWSGKPFAVFGLPLIMLVTHWLCILITSKDPKNKKQNKKVFGVVLWIAPIISFFASGLTYAVALGWKANFGGITTALCGLLFAIIGNYLPKCKQNHTIGIRVKWTLENEENWNATHRISGKVWVVGGLVMMSCLFLPELAAIVALTIVLFLIVLIPICYSYTYRKKQVREGSAVITPIPKTKANKVLAVVSLVFVAATLAFCGWICFTGDIEMVYEEESFTIEASYWQDLTVKYSAIDDVEYRENDHRGTRTFGFGSPRLCMGTFQNNEFGSYTRYSYTGCDANVVLTVKGKILVLSGKDVKSTMAIYKQLNEMK